MPIIATFEKDGNTKHAYDQDDVVRLTFDGWRRDAAADVDVPAGNASTEAWREYADGHHVPVPDDAKRGDIVSLLKDAGVPTETPTE